MNRHIIKLIYFLLFLVEKLPYSQVSGTKVGTFYKKRRQSNILNKTGSISSNYSMLQKKSTMKKSVVIY